MRIDDLILLAGMASLTALVQGCGGTTHEVYNVAMSPQREVYQEYKDLAENCQYIESRKNLATAVSATTSFLGGASGIATLPAKDDTVKIVFSASGIALGAVGAVAAVYSAALATDYDKRHCSEAHEKWKNFVDNSSKALGPAAPAPVPPPLKDPGPPK